jgi:hypothetical protein
VATWTEQGELIHKAIMPISAFEAWLIGLTSSQDTEVIAFIVEEYRVYAHMATAHIGSKVETAQCIGKIKMIAKMLGVPVIEQPATVLNGAAKWAGIKRTARHWPDDISAYLHGYYYLHKKKLIKARVLDD